MWLAVETHAQVIDIVGAPPFHAAPGLAEGVASIAHDKGRVFVGHQGFRQVDGQEITLLAETLHIGEVAVHIANGEALQLQHDSSNIVGCYSEFDMGLALQCPVGEIEIPNMDFIVGHVNAFAGSLRLYGGKRQ